MATDIKKLKLEGKTRDFAWYKGLQEEGKLLINGNPVKAVVFEQFRLAIKCVKEVYDENWDVDILMNGANFNIIGIAIHFPEITITNTSKHRHTIKDLFVRVRFTCTDAHLRLGNLEGGRMSMTLPQFQHNYNHSHLSGNQPSTSNQAPYYTNFCTGSGNINIYQMNINNDGFVETTFIQYLLAIVTLVNWESLEGTPYKRMNQVMLMTNNNSYSYSQSNSTSLYNLLKMKLKTPEAKFDLNIYIENDRYYIRDDEAFEKFLTQFPFTDSQKTSYLCYIGPDGRAYRYSATGILSRAGVNVPDFSRSANSKYIYKGTEMTFNVDMGETGEEEIRVEFKLHPSIKQYLKNELEYELNKQTVRQSTINRYTDQISDATESVGSDQVPV